MEADSVLLLLPNLPEGVGKPKPQGSVPPGPCPALVSSLDNCEEREIIKPRLLLRAKGSKLRRIPESSIGLVKELLLFRNDPAIIHSIRGKMREILNFLFRQEIREKRRGDQQRIAGKRAQALIGRIAVARGAKGAYLPQPLMTCSQQIDPLPGGFAEVADSEPRWK